MDMRFYASIFLRRLPWFVLMLTVGSAAGVTLSRVLPTVFSAQALLVVESEQIPDALAASTVQTQATEQLQIIQQRILTRERLLEMANRLQIYAPPEGQPAPRPLPADDVVEDLRERITIVTTGGQTARGPIQATLVRVGFEAPTAQLAASVANEVVTLILREDVAMRTSVARQTLNFFEQEVRRLDQDLARQGAAVLAFKAANKTALPDSLDFRRNQQAAAQERLLLIDRQEAELQERRAQLERMRAAVAGRAMPAGPDETAEQKRLRDARDELGAALAVLAPTHPRIRILKTQIAALDRTVTAQLAAAPGQASTAPVSPFDLQFADLDSQLRYVAASRAAVEVQMADLAASIDATPPNAITLGTLERDYANLRAQYDDTVAKKARAETGDVIEALSKGQRISIIEQASAPREPDRPNRPLIAFGGVAIGLALGIGMVLLLELLNPGIRRPVEITARLGITPFATFPYLRTRAEVLRRRVILGGAFAVAAAGVPLGLWLVHSQIMPLDLLIQGLMRQVGISGPGPAPQAG